MKCQKRFLVLLWLASSIFLGHGATGQRPEAARKAEPAKEPAHDKPVGKAPASRRGQTRPTAMDLVEQRFDRAAPQIGDPLPSLTVFDPDGREIPLDSLRGQYTVLTFGCLT